ncbi:MAG: DUF6624 domain-containing protein [Saprospiraceae bacterium]
MQLLKNQISLLSVCLIVLSGGPLLGQSAYWIPAQAEGVADGLYNFESENIRLAEIAFRNPNTSRIWNKIHRQNLFLAYINLKAPRDTVMKYFNWCMTTGLDYACERMLEREKIFEKLIVSKDSTIWKTYQCRCEWLFSTYDSLLIRQLDTISKDDQEIRQLFENGNSKYGKGTREEVKLWKKQQQRDSINLVKVEQIIERYGYPGKKLVGEEHSEVVFLVIQHAPLFIQEKYLYLIQAAAEADDIAQSLPAYLIDRIKMQKGENQIYGTQFIYNHRKEKMELYPVYKWENLNERRASMGLFPIEVELRKMGVE